MNSPLILFLGFLVCVQLVTHQGNAAQADLPGKGVFGCHAGCSGSSVSSFDTLCSPFPPSPAGGTEALAALVSHCPPDCPGDRELGPRTPTANLTPTRHGPLRRPAVCGCPCWSFDLEQPTLARAVGPLSPGRSDRVWASSLVPCGD